MESPEVSSRPEPAVPNQGDQPHLKADAISFADGLAIALSPSTAPAYPGRGHRLDRRAGRAQAPAALLVAFVPMFFIAAAFYYHTNKADRDCGTCFAWVTRAIGPQAGWMTGWAICVTGILVVGSLADVAATSFDLIGADSLMNSTAAVTGTAVALMIVMTGVCVWGTEISANLQKGSDGRADRAADPVHRRRPVQGLERRCPGRFGRPSLSG